MKTCTNCSVDKEEKDFSSCKSTVDKLQSWCRKCNTEAGLKWAEANRVKRNIYSRDLLRKERLKNPMYNAYATLLSNAAKRNVSVVMSKETFSAWLAKQELSCHYCSLTLKESLDTRNFRLTIDRKNNSVGYVIENIVLACFACNTGKGSLFTYSEWLEIAQKYVIPKVAKFRAERKAVEISSN